MVALFTYVIVVSCCSFLFTLGSCYVSFVCLPFVYRVLQSVSVVVPFEKWLFGVVLFLVFVLRCVFLVLPFCLSLLIGLVVCFCSVLPYVALCCGCVLVCVAFVCSVFVFLLLLRVCLPWRSLLLPFKFAVVFFCFCFCVFVLPLYLLLIFVFGLFFLFGVALVFLCCCLVFLSF